jgi:hypothetical protein
MALNIKDCEGGIQFAAFIQPRSANNKICGLHDEQLKIRVTSPPVDDAANKMCVKFLAKTLNISPHQIVILSGQQGRKKIIRINGMNTSDFSKKIHSIE